MYDEQYIVMVVIHYTKSNVFLFMYFYCYVYVLLLLCMFCSVYSVFFVPTGTLRLP